MLRYQHNSLEKVTGAFFSILYVNCVHWHPKYETNNRSRKKKKHKCSKYRYTVYKYKATSRIVAVERTQETNERTNEKKNQILYGKNENVHQ